MFGETNNKREVIENFVLHNKSIENSKQKYDDNKPIHVTPVERKSTSDKGQL